MENKVFYKMLLRPDEYGLSVVTEKFIAIRETERTYFCLPEGEYKMLRVYRRLENETDYELAKRQNKKIRRIVKGHSRIAFETKEEAFEHLCMLKRRQMRHMERDMKFIAVFLEKAKSLDDLETKIRWGHEEIFVPETEELVKQYFVFDI